MAKKSSRSKKKKTSRKKPASARRSGRGLVGPAVAQGKPGFIVIFREVSEKNVNALGKCAKRAVSTKTQAEAIPGVMAMGSARMHTMLGVAATDLEEGELERLNKSDEVERIVPNQERVMQVVDENHGPDPGAVEAWGTTGGPVDPFGTTGGPVDPFGRTAGPVDPFGRTNGPVDPFGRTGGPVDPFAAGAESLLPYIRGYRDGLVSLVDRLERSTVPAKLAMRLAEDTSALTYGLQMIGFKEGQPKLTGKGVRVAVLDTGIDIDHPDFEDRFENEDRLRSFIDNEDIRDVVGHGTHCAGTVGGPLNPTRERRYGVAPECDLYIGKVLDNNGRGWDSDILDGISWAIQQKCRVISLSLGSRRGRGEAYSEPYERVAQRLMNRVDGTLMIAAAGNESMRHLGRIAPVGNPAACPSLLSVAAVDRVAQVAWFSCGQQDSIGLVNVAAPGVRIYSSVPGGGFGFKSGTSMATPHVAGIAALIFEKNPGFTPGEAWTQIASSAKPLPLPNSDVGRGLAQVPDGTV